MSCSLYNNNGYGCGGCIHFVKTNSVTLQGNVLTLNIPQASYSNKERVCICIAQMIPRDWSKYTTNDVNDSVLPKFVKSAMEQYKQWEHETKELYEEQWQKCMNNGMGADADYISKLIQDVTKELKEINRMCEQLNGTGYDVISIHSMQDKYYEKYKNKYNDTYTDKWKKKEVKNKTQNK